MRVMWLLPMFLFACGKPEETDVGETDPDLVDADGDMFIGADDCNDADPSIFPGNNEVIADGVDQDCNGGELCFSDADSDGFRADATIASADVDCTDPGEATLTAPDGDCADGDAARNPAAQEVCDAADLDEDCDDDVDEEDADATGCANWAGTYTGDFALYAGISTLGMADSCVGTGSAVIDAKGDVELVMDCTFNGSFASYMPGPQYGSGSGSLTGDATAAGTLSVSLASDDWTGELSDPGTFTVSFTGVTTYSGYTVEYTGGFIGER